MINVSNEEKRYDFIVVGAGAAGSVLAAELSASGAQVLVIESGGPDDAPTILNPSIWFYNVGGPLDYHLPITPSPRLNNRNFNMALGHVLGGGSSINAMTVAVPKVAAGVTRGLFAGDLQRHWESLLAYDVRQVELDWSRMARG